MKENLVNWEAGYDAGYEEGFKDAMAKANGKGWQKCTTCGHYGGNGVCAKKDHGPKVCPDWVGTD